MNAIEKNKYQLKLAYLKRKFIQIGIERMPTKLINQYMPRLEGEDAIRWARKASDVWNGRSTAYEDYLPIFKKAYKKIKNDKVANQI